jgi:2-iminobutanoate/2-iminopropanoate deaminase
MKRREILTGLSVLPLAGTQTARAEAAMQNGQWTPKKALVPTSQYTTSSPLSTCIRSGHLLFVCGIGGWYPDQRPEPGDIKVQIHSALTTMKYVLETAGSTMGNVLKVHMSIAEPSKNIAPLNEVYRGFFPDPPPVRSYTGCSPEHMGRDGILLQIDCVAYVD